MERCNNLHDRWLAVGSKDGGTGNEVDGFTALLSTLPSPDSARGRDEAPKLSLIARVQYYVSDVYGRQ